MFWVLRKFLNIFLLIAIFLSSTNVSYAQLAGAGGFGGGAGGGAGGGINIGGVGGVLANCLLNPTELISSGVEAIGNLFGTSGAGGATNDVLQGDPSAAATAATNAVQDAMAVPVKDPVTRQRAAEIKKEAKDQNIKERCLDSAARFVVLKVIDKITLKTVEWINSGFEGNPFFPENRPNFFEELAQDEFIAFTGWFSGDANLYPFGQAISEILLSSVSNTFQQNMRFSLNQVLQHSNQYATYQNFSVNFSVGGWAGYTAMMQPNNNIFGNYLLANNHLARQTRGTNINIAENFRQELNEGLGVINQRKCARTAMSDSYYSSGDEYIDETNPLHLGNGYPLIPPGGIIPPGVAQSLPPAVLAYLSPDGSFVADSPDTVNEYNAIVRRSTCVAWRTVTPGRFIAEQTTQALGSPLRSLELGDELNENIGLIFDALLNQLVQQGLRAVTNSSGDYSSNPNSPNYSALWAQANNQDFGGSTQQPPITTALPNTGNPQNNSEILNIQQQYLLSSTQAIERIDQLIRDIRTLDYCVPGPNPRWYEFGSQNISQLVASVSPIIPPDENASYYINIINQLTGIDLSSNGTSVVASYGDFTAFMNYLLSAYRSAMDASYPANLPPPNIRPTANALFSQIEGYQSTYVSLQNTSNLLLTSIPQLQFIQSQLANLSPEEQANPDNPTVQSMTSLLTQLSSQGALVTQQQLDALNQTSGSYASILAAIDNYISQCITETTAPTYPAGEERVPYPFSSITGNQRYSQIPGPNNLFLQNVNFGDSVGEINLSGFNNLGITVPSVSTQQFVNLLQSVY